MYDRRHALGLYPAADPIYSVASSPEHIYYGHHNGIIAAQSLTRRAATSATASSPGSPSSSSEFEIAAHRGTVKQLLLYGLEAAAAAASTAGGTQGQASGQPGSVEDQARQALRDIIGVKGAPPSSPTGGSAAADTGAKAGSTEAPDDKAKENAAPPKPLLLLTCSSDETAKAWNAKTGEWVMTYTGHVGGVECMTLQDIGNQTFLLTGGADGTVRRWAVESGECLSTLKVHVGRVTGIATPVLPPQLDPTAPEIAPLVPEDSYITVSDDTLCKVTNPATANVVSLMRCEAPAYCVAYHHPSVLAGCSDGRVRGFNAATGAPTVTLSGHKDAINSLIAIEGYAYTASDDRKVIFWDLKTWEPLEVFEGHTKAVTSLTLSERDGNLLSGGFDACVRGWNRVGILDELQRKELEARQAAEAARLAKKKKDQEEKNKKPQPKKKR